MFNNSESRNRKGRNCERVLFNNTLENAITNNISECNLKRGRSKSFSKERYIPLTLNDKWNIIEDLNERSCYRFRHYSVIFDKIKQHLCDINCSFNTIPIKENIHTNDGDCINNNNNKRKSSSLCSWSDGLDDNKYNEEEIKMPKLNSKSNDCKMCNVIKKEIIPNWNVLQSETFYNKNTTVLTTTGRGNLNTNNKDDFYDEQYDNNNNNINSCYLCKSINCKCLIY